MIWIPITIAAALLQTLRNAAQRHLTGSLGTLGATLVRFLYGLPFALAWLLILVFGTGHAVPAPHPVYLAWTLVGAVGQVIATALLLRVMAERNFAIGIAYSKTEIIQVAVFSVALLGDPLSLAAAAAIALATCGVLMISTQSGNFGLRSLMGAWTSRAGLYGLGSGAAFAISAVGYRGGSLALDTASPFMAAAVTVVWAQAMQTVLLGSWLLVVAPKTVMAVLGAWRLSLVAGAAGAFASIGWFTAFTLEPVAHVRTLGLIEVLFGFLVSRRLFRERLGWHETLGMVLLVLGVAAIIMAGQER